MSNSFSNKYGDISDFTPREIEYVKQKQASIPREVIQDFKGIYNIYAMACLSRTETMIGWEERREHHEIKTREVLRYLDDFPDLMFFIVERMMAVESFNREVARFLWDKLPQKTDCKIAIRDNAVADTHKCAKKWISEQSDFFTQNDL